MALNFIEIGKQISNARHQAGLSQAQLSRLIGRDQSYLCKVESGLKVPSLELLVDIANQLDISMDTLVGSNLVAAKDDNTKEQFEEIFRGCSKKEKQLLLQIISVVKRSIRDMIQ
jgi:transcriptional regulator with XRE-family HTH domain